MEVTSTAVERRARTTLAAVAGGILAVLATLGAGAAPALAADPSVGAPTASVKFLESITYSGLANVTSEVVRVEIVIDVEGSTRSIVADVDARPAPGQDRLSYVLATPGGQLLPNTDVTARFRMDRRDGSTILGPSTTTHYDDTRFAWKTVQGAYVTVHYTDGGTAFGQRAASIGDDAIRQVSSLLGVTESSRIDFYVYADRQAFYDVLGPATRENVGGEAHPEIRTLFANIAGNAIDDPWVGVVIPHELTHLVFDTAVRNPYHYPPRWLNEGIAVYLSEGYGTADRSAMSDAAKAGTLMPLEALDAQFPTTQDRFYLAYSESVSAVSYLVDHYGRDGMVRLVKAYAGGVSDDAAFSSALGTTVAGFEAAWLHANHATTPNPYGPVAAPAGPVPPGWGGPAPTAGDASSAPDSGTVAPSESPSAVPAPVAAGGSEPTDAIAIGVAVLAVVVVALWASRQGRPRPIAVAAGPDAADAPSDPRADGGSADDAGPGDDL